MKKMSKAMEVLVLMKRISIAKMELCLTHS